VLVTAVTAVGAALMLALLGALVLSPKIGAMASAAIGSATSGSGFSTTAFSGFGVHTVLGLLVGSMFGADTSFSANLTVTTGIGVSSNGQVLMTLGLAPLGLTFLTLALTVLVWRRVTLRTTAASAILLDAVRTAVVAALLMLVLALTLTTNGTFSTSDGLGDGIDATVRIATSAVGACLSTLLVIGVSLMVAGLAGRNLFSAAVAPLTQGFGAVVKGLAAFVAAVAVMGLIVGICLDVPTSHGVDGWFANNTGATISSLGGFATLAVAYCGNLGLWFGSMGALGNLQATVSGQVIPHTTVVLSDMTSLNGAWWALVLVPFAAAAVGAVVAVHGRHSRNDVLGALAGFCVAVLAAVPVLGLVTNLRVTSFAMTMTGVWDNGLSISDILSALGLPYGMSNDSFAMLAGANLADAVLLIFLIALVVSFLVALASGVFTARRPNPAIGTLSR